jgi:hypothetical protein
VGIDNYQCLEGCCLSILKSAAEILNEATKILMRVIPHPSSNLAHLDQDLDQDKGDGLQIKLYLSHSYFFYEMGNRQGDLYGRKDEYDIDFAYAILNLREVMLK